MECTTYAQWLANLEQARARFQNQEAKSSDAKAPTENALFAFRLSLANKQQMPSFHSHVDTETHRACKDVGVVCSAVNAQTIQLYLRFFADVGALR